MIIGDKEFIFVEELRITSIIRNATITKKYKKERILKLHI